MIMWKAVIRDVIIIFVLTGLAGVVIGIAAAGRDFPMAAIAISNILFSIVGFTISGCLAGRHRFRHLFHVALGVWLLSAFNMLLPALGLVQWLAGSLVIGFAMVIGGGISFVFVRTTPERSQQTSGIDSLPTPPQA
jgi:hypothetical protein